jgi:integrase
VRLRSRQARIGGAGAVRASRSSRHVGPSTFRVRRSSTNQWNVERITVFVQQYGQKRLTDVSKTDAERFGREHPGRLNSVKAMFNDAVRDEADGLQANPFAHVKKQTQEGRRRITPLTRQEVDRLVQIAAETYGDYGRDVLAPAILLAAWTGVRPAELFALEWRDLDWEDATLHVRRQWRSRTSELVPYTKGYADRVVPVAPQVLEGLRRVPRIEGQPFVFFAKSGVRLTDAGFRNYWRKVRDRFTAELPEGHWLRQRVKDKGAKGTLDFYEATRHFAASELARRGVDTRDIARFLGHRDEGQLARETYIHLHEDESREKIRRALWSDPVVSGDTGSGRPAVMGE